ncbi:hypothetical protein ACFCVY_24250 [Streptomyces sp. NPDC056411]
MEAGHVFGVVSYATRPSYAAGFILWLQCREDRALADDRALPTTGPSARP